MSQPGRLRRIITSMAPRCKSNFHLCKLQQGCQSQLLTGGQALKTVRQQQLSMGRLIYNQARRSTCLMPRRASLVTILASSLGPSAGCTQTFSTSLSLDGAR